jgi:hypothetical protein
MQEARPAEVSYPLIVKCRYGQLIVTRDHIELKLGGTHARQSKKVLRSALIGIDTLPGVASLFGMGGAPNLQFNCMGDIKIVAEWVNKQEAESVKQVLGF